MRIAWATPVNLQSVGARMSRDVAYALRALNIEVEFIRTEVGEAAATAPFRADMPIHDWTVFGKIANRFDNILVNVGDDFAQHAGILQILRDHNSIGIFLRSEISNFVNDAVRHGYLGLQTCRRLRSCGERLSGGPITRADLFWLSALCSAGVVHSTHCLETVSDACPGPTRMIPLALNAAAPALDVSHDPLSFNITIVGAIGGNGQIDRVVHAMGENFRRGLSAEISLIGEISGPLRQHLGRIATVNNIPPPRCYGWLPTTEMRYLLETSDAVCVLGGSALDGDPFYLVASMYSGRPTIVIDDCSSEDVPDHLVWKVAPHEDPKDLAATIRSIMIFYEAAIDRAIMARAWASEEHTPQSYANKLAELLSEEITMRPLVECGRQIGAAMAEIGTTITSSAIHRIGKVAEQIFLHPVTPESDKVMKSTR